MRIYIQAFLVTLTVAIFLAAGFNYWREASAPKEALQRIELLESMEKQGLPDFSATTLKGEKFKLSDYKGKLVIVNFWASFCGPCVEEFPSLLQLANEMKGQLILVAVSTDASREEIDSFLKDYKDWDKPWVKVVWDEDRSISKTYEIDRMPESFIAGTHLQMIKKLIGSINWYTPSSISYMNEALKR